MPAPLDADARWRRAVESLSPDLVTVTALEITHPDSRGAVRVVNDTVDRYIESERFVALAFSARLVQDVEGEVPSAELAIDNVGEALTTWIHASGGGGGARVRVMEVSLGDEIRVEWDLTFRVIAVRMSQREIRARIGYRRLHDEPAVVARHDPRHSPGLF